MKMILVSIFLMIAGAAQADVQDSQNFLWCAVHQADTMYVLTFMRDKNSKDVPFAKQPEFSIDGRVVANAIMHEVSYFTGPAAVKELNFTRRVNVQLLIQWAAVRGGLISYTIEPVDKEEPNFSIGIASGDGSKSHVLSTTNSNPWFKDALQIYCESKIDLLQ